MSILLIAPSPLRLRSLGQPEIKKQKLSLSVHGVSFEKPEKYVWDKLPGKTTSPPV
jgi:hypothetical protein